ncbi:MAG: hypothetical protein ACT6RF_19180, partial [Allorhizobium sp.]|uniref:hypothetical protein n=1 Tax=Allorhizobium sp. TaxID=633478 RepID=UPI004033C813
MDRSKALSFYELFPFHRHPLWVQIIAGDLSAEQVLKAEIQHYLRTEIGKVYRERAAVAAKHFEGDVYDLLHQ